MSLSPDTQAAIRKYGPKINHLARTRYGISGQKLLGKLVIGESSDNMGAVSKAGARGKTQFTPGSRAIAIKKFGIDPWRSTDEAVHAAVLHLKGKINGSKGLEGYNPGDPNYPSYILGRKVTGRGGSSGTSTTNVDGGVSFHTKSYDGSFTKPDVRTALVDALLSGKKNPVSLALHGIETGQYDRQQSYSFKARVPDTTPSATNGVKGQIKVAANANRPGVNLQPYIKQFAHGISGILGHAIEIGTGTNHNRMTVDGNVSDHWNGSAVDIPATGVKGDRIAYAAFRNAGVDEHTAHRYARNGGLYNITHNGYRIQIIWKTNEGGNHFNHVHVGMRKL